MDKKRSVLNICVSIISRILLLVSALFVRRLLIRNIGNDVNGLNSLYTSIIGMLAVAELGIGNAITYSMYKPIVNGDEKQVAALYCLYRKLYFIIGAVIFCGGLLIMPFLPRFISDYENLHADVYLTFFLTLISVVMSYLYAAKTSLIEAYKDNYITTGILTVAGFVRYGLQIAAIIIWRSFPAFLLCQIIETVLIWILVSYIVRKRHGPIVTLREKVDRNTRIEIIRNSKAMFMHKLGTVLVNTIDNIIISTFIGVVILGKYSNYILIIGVVAGIITLFFTSLTSIVGHLCATEDKERIKEYFGYFYCLNYILGVVFFLGYYAIIDDLIILCFGTGLEVTRSISFVITLNQFIRFMRNTAILFRNASGTFYYDRWKPIGEGICNLILSLIFIHVFPEELRIVGVIAATIITNLSICHIVDPFVVYKYVFNRSVRQYCVKNYSYIGIFIISLIILTYLIRAENHPIMGIIINGFTSIGVSIVILLLVAIADKTFRSEVRVLFGKAIKPFEKK